jgi:Carbohydrate binding domain
MKKMKMFVLVMFALSMVNVFAAAEKMSAEEFKKLKEDGKLESVAKNPSFEKYRKGYSTWKTKGSKAIAETVGGEFASDGLKALKISNSDKGISVFQTIIVEPGEKYIITVNAIKQGEGQAKLSVRFKNAKGKWFYNGHPSAKSFLVEQKGSDWSRIIQVITVPKKAGKMLVMLGAKGQKENAFVCFDEFGVFKIK